MPFPAAFALGLRPSRPSHRYADDINVPTLFGPVDLDDTLGEVLANLGKRQLRLAETEKYAHVTYFFSGGREEPYVGEGTRAGTRHPRSPPTIWLRK